jgi:phosphate butyryltransferase
MEKIENFKALIKEAKKKGPVTVAVVAPHDEATILAVKEGLENNLAVAELFGDETLIKPLVEKHGLDGLVTIHHHSDRTAYIQAAVQSVREGKNILLMKGKVETAHILRVALDKTIGINAGRLCSFVAVCEIPGFQRLLLITDGALNIAPTLSEKVDIAKNAIDVAHVLGIINPKVAVLAAIEMVNTKMPATLDADALAKMSDKGEFGSAIVDGPFAFDNAISIEAAEKKDIQSPVAGRADIILVPCIEVGNALSKSINYIGKSSNATIVMGAKVPIIIPSRAGKSEAKWASLALGALLAGRNSE